MNFISRIHILVRTSSQNYLLTTIHSSRALKIMYLIIYFCFMCMVYLNVLGPVCVHVYVGVYMCMDMYMDLSLYMHICLQVYIVYKCAYRCTYLCISLWRLVVFLNHSACFFVTIIFTEPGSNLWPVYLPGILSSLPSQNGDNRHLLSATFYMNTDDPVCSRFLVCMVSTSLTMLSLQLHQIV